MVQPHPCCTTATHDDEMAKSARASVVKKNRSNLKKKVFGPAEAARNERLSAKLAELASQPKPLRSEMEVEHNGMSEHNNGNSDTENHKSNIMCSIDAENAEESEAKEDRATKGASQSSLSIPIPECLYNNQNLPTPPTTPTLDASATTTAILDIPAQKQLAKELLFFHLLGASSDIIGFDPNGNLQLSFAGPPP